MIPAPTATRGAGRCDDAVAKPADQPARRRQGNNGSHGHREQEQAEAAVAYAEPRFEVGDMRHPAGDTGAVEEEAQRDGAIDSRD